MRGCCFDLKGQGSLLVRIGGRWKIWAERTATVESAHSDSSETYTAACWVPLAGEAAADRSSQYVALGCASGRVQVWDPHGGELVGPVAEAFHAEARGADCSVADIVAAQPHRASVFVACTALPDIFEVGLLDGTTRLRFKASKSGVAKLAATQLGGVGWLLSCGAGTAALRLWQAPTAASAGGSSDHGATPKAHARFAGTANSALCLGLRAAASGPVLALCADGSCQVGVFEAGEEAAEKQQGPLTAAFMLSAHEPIHEARFVDRKRHLRVVGWGPSVAVAWVLDKQQDGAVTHPPAPTLAAAFAISASELGVTCVLSAWATGAGSLHLACGALVKPSFAEVDPPAERGGTATIVRRVAAPGKQGGAAEAPKPTPQAGPKLLKPAEAGVAAPLSQRRRKRAEEEESTEKYRKLDEHRKVNSRGGGGLSMAPLVRQGLRARDERSINRVMKTSDPQVIDSTALELSGGEAFDLIQECTQKLHSVPMEGIPLCRWIQRLLFHHGSFIGSQPRLCQALQPMLDIMNLRCRSYETLQRLQSRLSASRCRGGKLLVERQRKEEEEENGTPLIEYVEGDDEDDEELSESSNAGSDHEGEEEEKVDDDDVGSLLDEDGWEDVEDDT